MPDPISNSVPPTVPHIDLEPVVVTGKVRDACPDLTGAELGELALKCLPKMEGVALVAAGYAGSSIPVMILGGAKAVHELGQCLAEEVDRSSVARDFEECRENGGVPVGGPDQIVCFVPEDAP